ncbi:uncharacterized protein FTOL_12099 [Fusarium torulosum]|uniref:Uncharacterized protein n=1 Tax=Fusarium torulosum TaxID=33205 RepID=A0AAE8MJY2_9HYPO|nr:uncharacterized protein FTOL_12099 [Fusarium torulosum]
MAQQSTQDDGYGAMCKEKRLYVFLWESNKQKIATTQEQLNLLKSRARFLGSYHKRFPKGPDDLAQREHIEAFIDFLADLKRISSDEAGLNPASDKIMLIQRDLRIQLNQADHGEPNTAIRISLCKQIEDVIKSTKVTLEDILQEYTRENEMLAGKLMEM